MIIIETMEDLIQFMKEFNKDEWIGSGFLNVVALQNTLQIALEYLKVLIIKQIINTNKTLFMIRH